MIGDSSGVCPESAADVQTVSGSDDVFVLQEGNDTATFTVCVPNDSPGNVLIQWGADRSWKNAGNVGTGCVEIQHPKSVKVRAVETNFHDTATYYTCPK